MKKASERFWAARERKSAAAGAGETPKRLLVAMNTYSKGIRIDRS